MILEARNFSLRHTLECGQFFRYYPEGNGYFVLAGVKVLRLEQSGGRLAVAGKADTDSVKALLGLGDNYPHIISGISKDPFISAAIRQSYGLRLMRQEPWECMISYICSANSSVGKVRFCVNRISENFGKKISFEGRGFYGFPRKLDATEKELRECGLGYRAAHLARTLESVSPAEVRRLARLGYQDAKERLMELDGIGDKVADCIALYSLGFPQAFPVDRWVGRVMKEQYIRQKANYRQISSFAAEYFGHYAGYAQQFLFNFRRNL